MYQKFRNQFLSFSMYQSECLGGPCSTREPPPTGSGPGGGGDFGPQPSSAAPRPQALCSSCSTTTRAAVYTACGPWARGTPWTSLWVSRVRPPLPGILTGAFPDHAGLRPCPPLPHRGLPVLDVARPHLPAALSLLRTRKLSLPGPRPVRPAGVPSAGSGPSWGPASV